MKQVILSEHALFQMRERKIDRALIVSALIRPSREYTQASGRKVAIRKIIRDGRPYCIVVVYEDLPSHHCIYFVKDKKVLATMKFKYHKKEDALYLRFNDSPIAESDEVREGVILDLDKDQKIVGLEVLDVSKRFPRQFAADVAKNKLAPEFSVA